MAEEDIGRGLASLGESIGRRYEKQGEYKRELLKEEIKRKEDLKNKLAESGYDLTGQDLSVDELRAELARTNALKRKKEELEFKMLESIYPQTSSQQPINSLDKTIQEQQSQPNIGNQQPGIKLRPTGYRVGNMQFEIPQTQQEKMQEEGNVKRQFKGLEDLDTYSTDAMQAIIALNKIENQAGNLPKYERGALNQLSARFDAGIKSFSKDQDISRYMGVVAQELIPMARKLMEEKGPITEWDVNRVEKGLGDLTLPYEDKKFLMDELRSKVKSALKNKMDIAGISIGDFSKKYPTLSSQLGYIKSSQRLYSQEEKDKAIAQLRKNGVIK